MKIGDPGETEEEFSTRLANNLENLILKEGPETVIVKLCSPFFSPPPGAPSTFPCIEGKF